MFERKIATAVSITSLGIVLSGTAVFANSKTGTVTASALNIRSGPSTSNSVITYGYKGDKLEILETSNGWYKVKLSNGKIGWGSGKYISVSGESDNNTSTTGKTGTVTADALHVRTGPSTSYSKLTKVYQGQSVSIIESSDGWHKIKTPSGHVGWSSGEFISLSGGSTNGGNDNNSNLESNTDDSLAGKKATITASALNVRSGPSTGYNVIGTTYKGNTVEIITSSNGWHKVKLSNGQVGWVSGQYVSLSGDTGNSGNGGSAETPSTGKKATVTASALNVRSGPSTSNGVIGTVYKGNTVEILENSNGWSKIKTSSGQVGWASSQYLSTSGDAGNNGNGGNTNGGETTNPNKAQAIINLAKAQLGKPYVWGAEGPNAFDCSGLTYYVYGQNGVSLPRTAGEQSNVGTTISQSQLQPGDLIFSSTDGSGRVTHVGIYIGNGQMIHAPQEGDVVKVTNSNSSYWQSTFVTAKRVL
ncbi:C40 family peptidase [Paraclostridium sordellii]|uniref:SH3-domain-containing protein n=1 Tax=Paraclostridium sordellii TaxID=1505 RepID=A0A0C7PS85_PARSO|nr:C40 family peptidase [Paeniclostridium sordellii]QYE99190.1 SH3 domain-containing protein [Paeniclostridium sordellii]CEN77985.1 SH3-domain-containing protein [[Clostridium] sordellii] [Paeniclostridium sordellii]CEO07135.1 SH3-domain-containing protein [[Clostridium] sordellii] [Paeniclostridium sordellii]CEP86789.1 SH3-domain-containing protein [[Clostridium] sordellii] [Paeniclostridium sordellii]CEP97667.1 SH3-domain-containing protein [[Clostridium] sordellii] [Paeniclostridium sordell